MAPSQRIPGVRHHGLPDVEHDERGRPRPPSVCAGWLVALPMVVEATRAYGWAKNGLLSEFYGGFPLPRSLFDSIDVFSYEVEKVKAAVMKEASDG